MQRDRGITKDRHRDACASGHSPTAKRSAAANSEGLGSGGGAASNRCLLAPGRKAALYRSCFMRRSLLRLFWNHTCKSKHINQINRISQIKSFPLNRIITRLQLVYGMFARLPLS